MSAFLPFLWAFQGQLVSEHNFAVLFVTEPDVFWFLLGFPLHSCPFDVSHEMSNVFLLSYKVFTWKDGSIKNTDD